MQWNNGYVADVEYTSSFFPALSPTCLSFACILNDCEPVPLDKPFTYFELGFGQGFTLNILAASNPQGRFYGADFNPAHVASAQQLATDAQLDNLVLLERSFQELAAGDIDLPDFDFITLHGVYSWVNAENRRHIIEFVRRYLKPGGIVHISYNALPAWASVTPLQWLLLEQVNTVPGTSDAHIHEGRNLIARLGELDCGYFAKSSDAFLQSNINSLATDTTAYLAHEYLNQGWQPLYHADVARDLAAAKLEFAGSASLVTSMPHLYLTADQQTLLTSISDSGLRETVTDYMHNTGLRRDIFVRGKRRLTPSRKTWWLQKTGVALVQPYATIKPDLTTSVGISKVAEAAFTAVLDSLKAGPQTWSQLAALHELRNQPEKVLLEIVILLERSGIVAPYFLHAEECDSTSSQRLNCAIAHHSHFDDCYQALASPLLGNGTNAGLMQRLVYETVHQTSEDIDIPAVARKICEIMQCQNKPILNDGTPVLSPQEKLAKVIWTVEAILAQRLPIWRTLKMVAD